MVVKFWLVFSSIWWFLMAVLLKATLMSFAFYNGAIEIIRVKSLDNLLIIWCRIIAGYFSCYVSFQPWPLKAQAWLLSSTALLKYRFIARLQWCNRITLHVFKNSHFALEVDSTFAQGIEPWSLEKDRTCWLAKRWLESQTSFVTEAIPIRVFTCFNCFYCIFGHICQFICSLKNYWRWKINLVV